MHWRVYLSFKKFARVIVQKLCGQDEVGKQVVKKCIFLSTFRVQKCPCGGQGVQLLKKGKTVSMQVLNDPLENPRLKGVYEKLTIEKSFELEILPWTFWKTWINNAIFFFHQPIPTTVFTGSCPIHFTSFRKVFETFKATFCPA